jgi:hypothetical protein
MNRELAMNPSPASLHAVCQGAFSQRRVGSALHPARRLQNVPTARPRPFVTAPWRHASRP